MQSINVLHRFAYFPPPVLGTAARLINIKALINSASQWEVITGQDCKHTALGTQPVCQHLSKAWKVTMATKAIFHLLSLRKEGHIISFSFLFLFPCVTRSIFHWVSWNAQPRSLVISNSAINLPEYCFSLWTVSYLNTLMKGSSRWTEIWRSHTRYLNLACFATWLVETMETDLSFVLKFWLKPIDIYKQVSLQSLQS